MANRLRVKHKKLRKDKAVAVSKGQGPKRHKVIKSRSKRALAKKAYRC